MAHIDAGKTTTTERILYYTGRTHKMGEVHEGAATMDWMAQEQERGITITSAATTAVWRDHRINIIDTPGHVDFTVEVERSLRVLDGAVAVFDSVAGVQPQSETVWRQADKYSVPRIAFINKMDRTGADFFAAVQSMRRPPRRATRCRSSSRSARRSTTAASSTSSRCSAITYDDDLGTKMDVGEIPAELLEQAQEYHHQLIDAIAEFDDELIETYLDGRGAGHARDDPARAPRRARSQTRSRRSCSARRSRTRACSRCSTPSSTTCRARSTCRRCTGIDPKTERELDARGRRSDEPFSALAFKVMSDPYVGKLTYFRVYSGTLKAGDRVLNTTNGKTERIGRILQMHANHREEREEIGAGEIAAGVGLKQTTTGDTLAADIGADRARVDDVPRPGDLGRDRAEDEGRPGQARHGPRSASPRRTRPSASAPTRRPARRSSPAWASCTSRSSSTA